MICRAKALDHPLSRVMTLLIALTTAGTALAQSPAPAPDPLGVLKQRDQEMEALREQQKKSSEAEAALRRDIEAIGSDRRKLNQDLIDTAARIRDVEAKIAATEARLRPLDEKEQKLRQSLETRRDTIAQVLAALQRLRLHPPPALLVSPQDALKAVRSAILLGAVIPELRQQAQSVANDLGELVKLRNNIAAERDNLKNEMG